MNQQPTDHDFRNAVQNNVAITVFFPCILVFALTIIVIKYFKILGGLESIDLSLAIIIGFFLTIIITVIITYSYLESDARLDKAVQFIKRTTGITKASELRTLNYKYIALFIMWFVAALTSYFVEAYALWGAIIAAIASRYTEYSVDQYSNSSSSTRKACAFYGTVFITLATTIGFVLILMHKDFNGAHNFIKSTVHWLGAFSVGALTQYFVCGFERLFERLFNR